MLSFARALSASLSLFLCVVVEFLQKYIYINTYTYFYMLYVHLYTHTYIYAHRCFICY